jgi:hypothetical protein
VNFFLAFFLTWMAVIIAIFYVLAFKYDATGFGDTHLVPIHTPFKVKAPYHDLPTTGRYAHP